MAVQALYDQLNQGMLTSVKLVQDALSDIETHDVNYNAIAEISGDALKEAKALDAERAHSGPRSKLHGIPVLLKDNINTTDGMLTTAGSLALLDNHATYEATLVKKLRKAGAIILGKTNLSEFAYFMHQKDMPSGYSSRAGQVVNPYGKALDPLGSSTGSAVAVAAGYVPLTVGTETSGSLMAPAYHTSTVSIKPTVGLISRHGIIPISHVQDTAGPMGLSVEDCAIMLEVMKGLDVDDPATLPVPTWAVDYQTAVHGPIKGLKVGILMDHDLTDEEDALVQELTHVMETQGVIIKTVPFTPFKHEVYPAMLHEFKVGMNAYLKSVQPIQMKRLSDIIAYNQKHADVCLKYGQSILEAADALPGDLTHPDYLKARENANEEAAQFAALYDTHALDAIISLSWNSYGPALGHPSIVVPAKDLNQDLTPKSFVFMGPKWREETLIALAHHYEISTQHRKPPKP